MPTIPVTFGKDCTISGGGFTNNYVRSVTWESQAIEVDVHPFGTRTSLTWNAGYDCTVSVEMLVDTGMVGTLQSGSRIAISGSGYSGNFVVTSVQRSEPLDDVVTLRITAKLSI